MRIKTIVTTLFLTLIFSTTIFAANENSMVQRQQTVILNTSNHMADSDYQIIQLYGTRNGESDTLLYTVTNKIQSRTYDEKGKVLPKIGQNPNVTDVRIVCKHNGEEVKPTTTEYLDTVVTESLHEGEPKQTELKLCFEITPDEKVWRYEDSGNKKKNVYDGFYVVQRDEIHDKRNVTTKSNISTTTVLLNLGDPNGSAATFNAKSVGQMIKRSSPIRLLPNFYPATTSLSDFDQVYWYVTTESSVSANKLSDAYASLDESERLASNETIKNFMSDNGRVWSEVSTDKQLNYISTETGIDTVYIYCLVHQIKTDKWLISNIEKVQYATESLLYTGEFLEGSKLNLALLKTDTDPEHAIFYDSVNHINNIPISSVTSFSVVNPSKDIILPGQNTYYGLINANGKQYNVVLQIMGIESKFKVQQLKQPLLGEHWYDENDPNNNNMLHSNGHGPYFNYKYGDTALHYPAQPGDAIKIEKIAPANSYIREQETLMNVTLDVYGTPKRASFIAHAMYSGTDTTDTSTTVLSIAITKKRPITLSQREVDDNDVSNVKDDLMVVATRFDGTKEDVTSKSLFNIRRSGRYAVIIASYAQCSSSLAVDFNN